MSNELWFHALKVLDTFRSSSEVKDVSKLYEFQDETGILNQHKEHLESTFKQEQVDIKIIYFELIKMLLDQDMHQHPEGFLKTREVGKIQGFQELTNRLQFNLNEKYLNQICTLGDRIQKMEGLLKGGDNITYNIFERVEELEQKLGEVQTKNETFIEENINANMRLTGVETQNVDQEDRIDALENDIKVRDDHETTEKMIQDQIVRMQNDTLATIEKRIDTNENHIKLLEEKDDDMDANLEEVKSNFDNRLLALEKADEFLQEAYKGAMTKAQKIEDEENNLGINVQDLKDAFDNFKEDQEMHGQKVQGKLDNLTNETKDLDEDQDKIKEMIRQLEGVSNDNAEVINNFTIQHIVYNDKLDKLESESHEFGQDITEKMAKLTDTNDDLNNRIIKNDFDISEHEDRLDGIEEVKKDQKQTREDLEHLQDKTNDKLKNLEDHVSNMENDVNGNKQKIEDANKVIKRHTEQLLEIVPEMNDLKHEVSEMEKSVQHTNDKLEDTAQKTKAVDETQSQDIDDLKDKCKGLEAKDEDLDERINKNLEKLVEEQGVVQQEKVRYVENLNERLTFMDEQKQQSEAKVKEEVEEKIKGNNEAVENLKAILLIQINEAQNKNKNDLNEVWEKTRDLDEDVAKIRTGTDQINQRVADLAHEKEKLVDEVDHVSHASKQSLEQLEQKIEALEDKAKQAKDEVEDNIKPLAKKHEQVLESLKENIDDLNDKIKDSVKDEMEALGKKVHDKLEDVDNECQVNAGHVENLRLLNKNLLERIKEEVTDDIVNHKDMLDKSEKDILDLENKLDNLNKDLDELKNKELSDLVEAKFIIEQKVKDLEAKTEDLGGSIKTEHEHFTVIFRESKETNEKMLKELHEKLVVVEKTQDNIGDIQMIKETIDSLEDKYNKAEQDRGEINNEIRVIDERYTRNFDEVDNRRDSDAKFSTQKIQKIETVLDANYEDMWKVVMPIYGALRGYTVTLYSDADGMAAKHQAACLGVYRSMGYNNGRPAYKQDEGEIYLYYKNKNWLIGPQLDRDYAWIRNRSQEDSSSSDSDSSSSSSSSSSSVGNGRIKAMKKRMSPPKKSGLIGGHYQTPDQLESGWQYRLLICLPGMPEEDQWQEDDSSLCVEALKDMERISKVIRRVRAAKEID